MFPAGDKCDNWHVETLGIIMRKALAVAADVMRVVLFTALLVAPIIVYRQMFGAHLSTNVTDWTNFGTAMGGIYGPLLTVLTLFVLTLQVRLQAESGKHVMDQSHIQQANSDIVFYLGRLEAAVKVGHIDGIHSIGQYFIETFAHTSLDRLREIHAVAMILNHEHPQLYSSWSAYQSIVAGLQVVKENPYKVTLSSAQQRASAVLSFEMCVALDNFAWCLSEGRLEGPYLFSPLLRQPRAAGA
jgi:hypothetical protein